VSWQARAFWLVVEPTVMVGALLFVGVIVVRAHVKAWLR